MKTKEVKPKSNALDDIKDLSSFLEKRDIIRRHKKKEYYKQKNKK